ncbi:MAG: SpoIVB peptidase S55 domain-containing protein [Erysipelotrichaceae bacterium]|nr:SpoIVB peptidase S55 domain-containing protein [Erysipelotrichaceae bacterium]
MKHRKIKIFLCLFFFFVSVPIFANEDYVILGGDSIAIITHYNGVYITGRYPFEYQGSKLEPRNFDVKEQDIIISVNGHKITTINDFYQELSNFKHPHFTIPVEVSRNERIYQFQIPISYYESTGMYKTGLYMKDELSGVGTLTYYDPITKRFGALGHHIANTRDIRLISQSGQLYQSKITSFSKSNDHQVGEKFASLSKSNIIGTITKSNSYGVFGNYHLPLNNRKQIPIAKREEIQLGKAYIYTVLENQTIQKYEIQITHLQNQSTIQEKGITFQIIDPELLQRTGGIIQGMSGSPIVQNGKLIGAITHVISSNPKKGYGIYIEWMILQTDS